MNSQQTATLESLRARLEAALAARLPPPDAYPPRLHQAMRYAADGGKRLRALLVYAAGEALGVPLDALDAAAVSVELIHAYSLVHDDLPAMDDDALRRGRPTVHVAYDEATAILVGDALQALAFEVLAQDTPGAAAPAQRLAMVAVLAQAAGSRGMVGGQMVDIESEGRTIALAELERLHAHKTGALILACVQLAACAADGLAKARRQALERHGRALGLGFQIQDDVLDVEGSTEQLGKTQGKDRAQAKSTYVSLLGLTDAKRRATELFREADAALADFGSSAARLHQLAALIRQRRS
ncbi:MAG: polyprenyl synthetase family protein [Gammaproteobacteria bacterium]|nr:polyprenyl synthetase family protein [Gammaproteobacteria bacterium]